MIPTKLETYASQKRQERLKVRAKLHNKGLTRERDLHWIVVEKELLRCELCGKTKIFDKAMVMFQQRCMTAKQEGRRDKICDKLNREINDVESDHEEARISRNLSDLFEQTARTEEAMTTAAQGTGRRETNGIVTGQETERAEQGHFGEAKPNKPLPGERRTGTGCRN